MSVFAGPAEWWTNYTNDGRTHIATKGIVQSGLILNLDAGVSSSYSGSGTTWTTLSGSINGTISGATYSTNSGGSFAFDGVSNKVDIGSSVYNASAGTLGFWMKSGTVSDIYNTHSGSWNQNSLYHDTSTLIFRMSNGTTNPGDVTISSSLVYDNIFHFVCVTWTVGGERALWLDGIKMGSLSNTLQCTPSATLEIGYKSWTPVYYNGTMSAIVSYNRALSTDEIQQNFNALRGRFGI